MHIVVHMYNIAAKNCRTSRMRATSGRRCRARTSIRSIAQYRRPPGWRRHDEKSFFCRAASSTPNPFNLTAPSSTSGSSWGELACKSKGSTSSSSNKQQAITNERSAQVGQEGVHARTCILCHGSIGAMLALTRSVENKARLNQTYLKYRMSGLKALA